MLTALYRITQIKFGLKKLVRKSERIVENADLGLSRLLEVILRLQVRRNPLTSVRKQNSDDTRV